MMNNKDGKYAWRPMQLIHPVLYVSLVHKITEQSNWQLICDRFEKFVANKHIICLSLPVESLSDKTDKAEQVTEWWLSVEQQSIELALEYEYLFHTDIADCYGSIYTHSIAWALHTKEEAKKTKNRNNLDLVGVFIDKTIQDMSYAQTNGIPQGSVLSDFIAEIVLGYADSQLSESIGGSISDYKVLRYRDDYRVFVNKQHILIIHDHATNFPNSGSLMKALLIFYKRLSKLDKAIDSLVVLISISTDIAYRNPKTYPVISAILSKLIALLDNKSLQLDVVEKIQKRFSQIPNTGYMDIWMQRFTWFIKENIEYSVPLCRLVTGSLVEIWNIDWISCNELKNIMKSLKIIDTSILTDITPIISTEEIELFEGYR